MSILIFIVILLFLVLVHELGHFWAAKSSGIRVDEFGIGFPPRLFKKKYKGTLYSLNLLLVGGFVRIFGEQPDAQGSVHIHEEGSFAHKPRHIQAWVVSAGVLANILLAYILITVGLMLGTPASPEDPRYGARVTDARLVISGVAPGSSAAYAGLMSGDEIVGIDGLGVGTITPDIVRQEVSQNAHVTLTYLREGDRHEATINPILDPEVGIARMGIVMSSQGILKLPLIEALGAGALLTVSLIHTTLVGMIDFLSALVLGSGALDHITGPVGMVSVVHDASLLGISYLLQFVAVISVNLAIINILPFPALDGGRLLIIIIESIKRSPLKPVVVNAVNGLGFLLLILLMVVVTYHDIARLLVG